MEEGSHCVLWQKKSGWGHASMGCHNHCEFIPFPPWCGGLTVKFCSRHKQCSKSGINGFKSLSFCGKHHVLRRKMHVCSLRTIVEGNSTEDEKSFISFHVTYKKKNCGKKQSTSMMVHVLTFPPTFFTKILNFPIHNSHDSKRFLHDWRKKGRLVVKARLPWVPSDLKVFHLTKVLRKVCILMLSSKQRYKWIESTSFKCL